MFGWQVSIDLYFFIFIAKFFIIGYLVGPVVGGVLYENFGFHAPFLVCAVLAAIDFVFRWFAIDDSLVRLFVMQPCVYS